MGSEMVHNGEGILTCYLFCSSFFERGEQVSLIKVYDAASCGISIRVLLEAGLFLGW